MIAHALPLRSDMGADDQYQEKCNPNYLKVTFKSISCVCGRKMGRKKEVVDVCMW